MKQGLKRITTLMMVVTLVAQGYVPAVQAGLIDTQTVVQTENRLTLLNKTDTWFAQQSVADQLQQMGVDAADVKDRMHMMTDDELQTLAAKMDSMPAGAGALEVLGVIFLVLLILELVGVTNIFNRL